MVEQLKQTRNVVVTNSTGLHARAALAIARLVSQYQAEVALVADSERAEATSIIKMLALGARPGQKITLEASGPGAEAALDALERLFAEKFHEEDDQRSSQG
ncbi:MAG: HPr family phosphocarrier protein [Thermoguttaceae bacterium]